MKTERVGFIGAGNIATAIVRGALQSGYIKPENIYIYDLSAEKSQKLAKYGVQILDSVGALVRQCDYVFLTIKPQVYEDVLSEIRPHVTADTCLIDVAAGITIDYVKQRIGFDCNVIRIMPNTPLMYGYGACAMVYKKPVSEAQFAFIQSMLDRCGVTSVVEEDQIDAIIGVSGSAPAYFFRFVRNLIDCGVREGLPEEVAKRMALQTMLGSANMILQSDCSIDDLIRAVASPNGTTEAGLRALDEMQFEKVVSACFDATVARSKELTK